MDKPQVTTIELTSGEIINLIDLIHNKVLECDAKDDDASKHLARYYDSIAGQFDTVLGRLVTEVVPEKRLAKLVLAL